MGGGGGLGGASDVVAGQRPGQDTAPRGGQWCEGRVEVGARLAGPAHVPRALRVPGAPRPAAAGRRTRVAEVLAVVVTSTLPTHHP